MSDFPDIGSVVRRIGGRKSHAESHRVLMCCALHKRQQGGWASAIGIDPKKTGAHPLLIRLGVTMTRTMTIESLADDLRGIRTRTLIGIAGPPGAGKSTLAEGLQTRIPDSAILPMDGFHYDDAVLTARGHLDRKGAPHTFDVAGLRTMLHRIRHEGGEIAVPVFDRGLEISRAAARIIGAEVNVVLVEGNYLLLDDPEWETLRPYFDMTVMLDVPLPVLEQRLRGRWSTHPHGAAKVEGNDLPNARRVVECSVAADVSLPSSLA